MIQEKNMSEELVTPTPRGPAQDFGALATEIQWCCGCPNLSEDLGVPCKAMCSGGMVAGYEVHDTGL